MKRSAERIVYFAALISFFALPAALIAADVHQHAPMHDHAAAPAPAQTGTNPANPLIAEMQQLDSVFREIVSGVALGDGERVHKAIETMHGTMEHTQEALHSGEVKPPKNADKLKEFEMLDKEFHKNLESLGEAAHANDQKKMLGFTKKLMDGCVTCHSTFRK